MNKALKKLLASKGGKRLLASLIAVLTSISMLIPGLGSVIVYLQSIAGAVGGVGVAHAASAGTLGAAKIASLSSIFSFLILLSHYVPALVPYVALLQQLATGLGISAVSMKLVEKK